MAVASGPAEPDQFLRYFQSAHAQNYRVALALVSFPDPQVCPREGLGTRLHTYTLGATPQKA